MNKETGIAALKAVIASKVESRSSLARKLGIDASQVSRIASGQFRRMSGNALNVCKFAYSLQALDQARSKAPKLTTELESKMAQLITISPGAAEALTHMLDVLIEDLSPSRNTMRESSENL